MSHWPKNLPQTALPQPVSAMVKCSPSGFTLCQCLAVIDIKAIIATSAGDIAGTIDAVVKECPSVETLILVNPAGAGAQDDHDEVAAADAAVRQEVRRLVRPRFHVGEGEGVFFPFRVAPDHGRALGVVDRDIVHDVVGEVEVVGHGHGMIATGGEPCVFLAIVMKPEGEKII